MHTGEAPDPVVNRPPMANISGPINVHFGGVATLDASGSSDPDHDALRFNWKFPQGLTAIDHGAATLQSASVAFKAPSLKVDSSVTFDVTVSDGKASSVAYRTIIVEKKPAAGEAGGSDPVAAPPCAANTPCQARDKVSNNGKLYQCQDFPKSGWCSQAPAAYAPGIGYAWQEARTEIAY